MFKKENHTLVRINKRLGENIGQWLLLNQDIDARLITMGIKEIHTAKDLSLSKVYIYHSDNPNTLAKKLNQNHHPLHQFLFKNLSIRKVPKVKFLVASEDMLEEKFYDAE